MSSLASASTASGPKARAMRSLCASLPFKHYRRSTMSKAPRKRTFLVQMTKFNVTLACEPIGAFSHNVAMSSCGVCCENNYNEMPCGDNGDNGDSNNNGNNGSSGNNNDNNNFGPLDAGDNSAFSRILQSFAHAMLGAAALVTAVAIFPDSSVAAVSTFASGARHLRTAGTVAVKGCPPASSASAPASCNGGSSRPRSKVLHVPCKGSTLVVPLCDPKAAASLGGRAKVVDAPIDPSVLSGREVAIINRRQYCVRESMLV